MSHEFLDRFHNVWVRKRRVQLGQVVAATLLLTVIGFGALALCDYIFEWSYSARAVGLWGVGLAIAAFFIRSLWRTTQNWSQPATAAEIEATFPTLGQAVRTTVQFSELKEEQVQSAGVAATLVTALADQTAVQTKPLVLDNIVPKKRMWTIAAGTALVALLLTGAAGVNWEWQTASRRAALGEQPYRLLHVNPGNVVIDEDAAARIAIALVGRTNREVSFFTRPAGQPDGEWTERVLEKSFETGDSSPEAASANHDIQIEGREAKLPRVEFVAQLSRLTKPLEYRVVAGELASEIYRIDIRRPLKIQQVRIDLTPPTYTGQATSTVLESNLSVLQGTNAKFAVSFDKPIKSATLVFAARKRAPDSDETTAPEVFPLVANGAPSHGKDKTESIEHRTEITLNEDRVYSIVAEATDGTKLAENKFRIRVREDQPPQIFFDSPDDAIEVHTLAELPMRVRVRDDYGISKAGVIFQVNNEQEIPLIAQDFETVAQAATEVEQTGKVSPATQAALEKILPLEHFELTQKDSVMYFAYAEDNLPGRPQRTETDLRFIDIRPFKREYQVQDPDPMAGMGNGTPLKTLEELVQRQRFALNRTIQFEKRAAAGQKPDANSLDQLMKFETELAQFVRETAQGLESRGFDDTELFYQAEAAMLQAVDSLSVGKWDNATLQMRDALKFLIEQRDRTRLAILKNPDRALLAALRSFDRQQAQKLRRPKSDKEEARELIRRLEQLVSQETDVAGALGGEKAEQQGAEQPGSEQQKTEGQKTEGQKTEGQKAEGQKAEGQTAEQTGTEAQKSAGEEE